MSDNNRRLRTIIIVDVITAFSATVFMFVIRATVVSSTYLTVAAGMVAASGVVMAVGLLPLRHGNTWAALRWLAVANWSIAIAAATVATFSWPLMMMAALLPCVLAATFITGRELAVYVAISVFVSIAVVLVGNLQDFSGLTESTPQWLRDVVVILFAPALAGLVALMVTQHSMNMQAALASVRASRAELAAGADELRAVANPTRRGDRPGTAPDRARPSRRCAATADRNRHRAVAGQGALRIVANPGRGHARGAPSRVARRPRRTP